MKPERFIFVILAIISLIAGIWTGLTRLGWDLVYLKATAHHGAIMVGGFLGTIISLEKAIPLKKKAFLVIPIVSASSIIFFITGNFMYSFLVLILASIGLCSIYITYLLKQYDLTLLLMLMGSLCWLIGNVLLLTKNFYPFAVPWWMAFLLFTIVPERLELSKFLPVTNGNKNILLMSLGLFLLGTLLPFHGMGTYFSGVGLIFIGSWLIRFDIVRIAIKKQGLTQFTGIALLVGYISLIVDGIFLIILPTTGSAYDAILHTFFIGFTFSMIFAHGPIIFPGVLGSTVKPFHAVLYIPLILLILSVILRVSADLFLILYPYRMASGWISAGSILLYLGTMFSLLVSETRRAKLL